MSEETPIVKLNLIGGNLNFTCDITIQKAAQIIAFASAIEDVNSHTDRPQLAFAREIASTSNSPVPSSAIDAIRQSGARTYPQKIASLGSFILNRNNTETFDQKELLALLRRMGDTPRNFTRDLNNAELLGYITREPNGEYFLTDLGRQAIDSQFADALSASSTSKKKRPRKKSDSMEELPTE